MAVRQAVLNQIYRTTDTPACANLHCHISGPCEGAQARQFENINKQLSSTVQAQKMRIQRMEENILRACRSHEAQLQEICKGKQKDPDYRQQKRSISGYSAVDMPAWQVAMNDVVFFIGLSSPIWLLVVIHSLL